MNQPLNMAEQRLADTIEEVTADLTNSTANIEVIREDFFVNVFLPMFSGTAQGEQTRVTPEMWFNVAHGPFNEVTVVNAQNEPLFNVPPYFSPDVIKPLDGTGKAAGLPTITDMVKQAQHHAFRGPGLGDAFLLQELERRSFMFDPNADLSEDNKRWNEIFARYGVKPVQPEQPLNHVPANADITRDSTDFESLF